jgi:hypothetical protein
MDWEDALELCESILSDLEELPNHAFRFYEGIKGKVLSIQDWVEENEHITDKQAQALENMHEGVRKWFH